MAEGPSSRCRKAIPRALSSELLEERSTACATSSCGAAARATMAVLLVAFLHPPCQLFVDLGVAPTLLHLWTPPGAREEFSEWIARSRVLTSVRPLMRPSLPRARMGVRGSDLDHGCALEALCNKLVFRSRLIDRCAILSGRPSYAPDRPLPRADHTTAAGACRFHPSPAAPRRCGPSCWQGQRSQACVASARASVRTTIPMGRRAWSPGAPWRSLQ